MLHSSVWRRYLVAIFLLFSAMACSNKSSNNLQNNQQNKAHSELLCQDNIPILGNDSQILELKNNVQKVRHLLRRYALSSMLYRGFQYAGSSDLGPTNPLVVSQVINDQYLKEIYLSLSDVKNEQFHQWLIKGNVPATILSQDISLADEHYLGLIVSKIEGLYEMQERLRLNICQKQQLIGNRKNDIRDFAILINGECPDGLMYVSDPSGIMVSACLQFLLDQWNSLEERYISLKNKTYAHLRALCTQMPNAGECYDELSSSLQSGKGFSFWNTLKANYRQKKYDPLFRITEYNKNIQCSVSGKETKVYINVVFNSDISPRMQAIFKRDLVDHVAEKWSRSGKMRIIFTFEEQNVSQSLNMIISWSNMAVSYVPDHSNHLMFINREFENEGTQANRRTILAHEFGHVLGFKDCYVEFYESENNQFIFYQIDARNIMCTISPQAFVPDTHYLQIMTKRCVY